MKTGQQFPIFLSKNKLNALIAVFFLVVAGLACGSNTPPPSQYVGVWTGDDGTLITIRADGSADYKSGGTSVDNGGLKIDDAAKTLKITFAGMGPTYTIDKPPSGNQMTLSGVVFKKSGGGSSDSMSDTVSTEVPGNEKLQQMVKTTMKDFSDGIRSGDFGHFRGTCSTKLKDSLTPENMRGAFKDFIEQKSTFDIGKAVANLDAVFEPAPSIIKNSDVTVLKVAGYYSTTPNRLRFKFDYTMEDGSWKLSFIKLDIGDEK